MTQDQKPQTIIDAFIIGARRGVNIAFNNIAPNVIMAFVIIEFLNLSGLLTVIGKVFGPVMKIFGLPGEAITVLVAGWLSLGGGVGTAASLYSKGILNNQHVTILMPGLMLIGAQLQYMGRILITAGVESRKIGPIMLISLIVALAAMFVFSLFV